MTTIPDNSIDTALQPISEATANQQGGAAPEAQPAKKPGRPKKHTAKVETMPSGAPIDSGGNSVPDLSSSGTEIQPREVEGPVTPIKQASNEGENTLGDVLATKVQNSEPTDVVTNLSGVEKLPEPPAELVVAQTVESDGVQETVIPVSSVKGSQVVRVRNNGHLPKIEPVTRTVIEPGKVTEIQVNNRIRKQVLSNINQFISLKYPLEVLKDDDI